MLKTIRSLTSCGIFGALVFVVSLFTSGCLVETGDSQGRQGEQVIRSNEIRETCPEVSPENREALALGNSAFAFGLYHVLESEQDGNFAYSPHSISTALAMAYAGARGQTALEMAEALHFVLANEELHPAFNALHLDLESRGQGGEPFLLHLSNALWAQRDLTIIDGFLDILAVNYDSGVRLLDFVGEPELCRSTINQWVSDQTERRIEDLIPLGEISSLTRMVLTNVIHFTAAWANKFQEEDTRVGDFTLLDGSQVTTEMMSQAQSFFHGAGQGYQAIALPYDGYELSMVIVMPDEGTLEAFEANMDAGTIESIIDELKVADVYLTLPSFTFSSPFSVKDALVGLGMRQGFSSAADFSAIALGTPLQITDIVHEAFVSVDESGTEAAASTAVIVGKTSAGLPPTEMIVDSPFIFLIRDDATGTILFLGRMVDPTRQSR